MRQRLSGFGAFRDFAPSGSGVSRTRLRTLLGLTWRPEGSTLVLHGVCTPWGVLGVDHGYFAHGSSDGFICWDSGWFDECPHQKGDPASSAIEGVDTTRPGAGRGYVPKFD